jgi:hypothetical protein
MPHEHPNIHLWGFSVELGVPCYRAPLPPTPDYPMLMRSCGNIAGIKQIPMPPYIMAQRHAECIEFDLFEADGYRIGYDRDSHSNEACLYADSEDLPEEWRESIQAATDAVTQHWPGLPLRFRPRSSDWCV